MALVEIPAFLGERNVLDGKSLPLGSLSLSSNIDIDDSGVVNSREGFTLSQAFTSITASFTTSDEQRMFIIDGGNLQFVNSDFTTHILKTGMPTGYVKWLEVADYIFLNTGHVISPNLDVYDWRVPKPEQPKITVVSGQMPAGLYQVVSTYRDGFGREGASSDVAIIEVNDNAGLNVEPSYVAGYESIVYVTDTNGQVFYLHGEALLSGPVTITDTSLNTYPIDRHQLDADQLPDAIGSIAFYEGSVWASEYIDGVSYLWKSKPFWWHLFDVQEDYLPIQGKITALQGTSQGLFIGTDSEMFIYTLEDSLVRLAEYGVIAGKPISVTDDGHLFVWTAQGVCTLFPFQNITQDKVSLPAGCICSTAIIEKNGYQQFMVLNNGTGTAFNALN